MADFDGRFKQVTKTASQWTTANTVLLIGEIGFESDTGFLKIGNGATAWNSLGYFKILTAGNMPTAIDAAKLADGSVSNAEFQYLNGTTSAIQTQIDAKQASDADLTAIAGLSPSNNDFIQRKSGAWANRTIAEVKTDLGISGTNTGDQDLSTYATITQAKTECLIVAASDETTALTTGTAKVTFRMPYAFTLSAVRASATTAPTGSTIIVDINEGGSTILSTKLSIDASEKTSTTAASAAVISDLALADDAEISIDVDQVGSTVAGSGLKIYLIGVRA